MSDLRETGFDAVEASGSQGYVAQLERERRLLAALMSASDAHLAFLDHDLRFVSVNEAYARGAGYEVADLIGRYHFELFPNAENETIFRRVRDTGRAESFDAKPFEYVDQPWRGVTYWDWRLAPVKDEQGRVTGLMLSLADVTRTYRAKWLGDILAALNESIHASLDLNRIVDAVLPELVAAVGCEIALLAVRDEKDGWRLAGGVGVPPQAAKRRASDSEVPWAMQAVTEDRLLVLEPGDPRLASGMAGRLGASSLALVPLSLTPPRQGVLVLGHVSGPGTFDQPTLDFAERLASSLSLAVVNSALYESQGEHARRMTVLKDIAGIAASALDRAELAKRLACAIPDLLGAFGVLICLADREGDRISPAASVGVPEDYVDSITPIPEDTESMMVFETGRPRYVSGREHDGLRPGSLALSTELGMRSAATLPLQVSGQTIGTIGIYWPDERVFTSEERTFLASVASQVGAGLENARLYESERARRQRIEALHGVLEVAISSLDVEQCARRMLDYLVERHDFDLANVWLHDGDFLELAASTGYPSAYGERYSPMRLDSKFDAPAVFRHGRPKVEQDASVSNPAVRALYESIGVELGSYVIVPLRAGGETIGTLHLGWHRPRPIRDQDVDYYVSLGAELGVALENARLYDAERRSAVLGRALAQIDALIHSTHEFDTIVNMALNEGLAALGADTAAVSFHEPGRLVIRYVAGWPADAIGTVFEGDRDTHGMLALATGSPVLVDDALTDPAVVPEIMAEWGIRSVAAIPLATRGNPLGVLYFNHTAAPHRFTASERDFATKLGASLSLALENARLFEKQKAAARISDALARIDQSIHATLDRDEMLGRVAAESAEAIGAHSMVLCMRKGDVWTIRYAHDLPPHFIGREYVIEQAPFIGMAMESESVVAVGDAYNDPRTVRETQVDLGVAAVMMAPLIVRGEIIGGLFFNYTRPHEFSDQEIDYARRLGLSVALAIANIGLYEAERAISDRLQEALLSLPEEVEGVRFAHTYQGATEHARVGGDFYDIFQLSQDHVGIVIGDVSGKGLDAAVLTSLVKNTIRAHANERGKTPARILELTNEVVYKASPVETFVTVCFGILDCRDGRLVQANAGHTLAMLACADDTVARLPVTGPLLGAFSGVRFTHSEARLHRGELLFLYTDGLTEARGGDEQYGEERLAEALSHHRGRGVEGVITEVLSQVTAFAGDRFRDDVAVLAVERTLLGAATPHQEKLDI